MENPKTNICPYLGMKNDPTTPVGYPSTWNACFHSKKHGIPNLNYQKSMCLTDRYTNCSVYKNPVENRLPRSIRYRNRNKSDILRKIKYIILVLIPIIGIGTILFFYRQWSPKISDALIPSWQKTLQVRTDQPLPTIPHTQIPGHDGDVSNEKTHTPTTTATPNPTGTATQTITPSILALDTPIGADIKFVIHRADPGESLFQYARQYNTDVDAIIAVNYDLPAVLYVDWVVVIPLDLEDPTGLPSFEAFQVTMRGLTVETIAEELTTDPESLSKFNNVPMDYKFTPGEWILVPRE